MGVPSFPLPEGRQSRRLHNKSTACRRSSWPPVLRLPGRASASTQTYCLVSSKFSQSLQYDADLHSSQPLDVTWTLSSTPLPGLCWRSSQAPSPAGRSAGLCYSSTDWQVCISFFFVNFPLICMTHSLRAGSAASPPSPNPLFWSGMPTNPGWVGKTGLVRDRPG